MEAPKEQQEWDKMKENPYYANDPLCCEAEIPGGKLIMEYAMIKKNDNVNEMTYEQLITWKKYTEEQILDMEFGPVDARWLPGKSRLPYLPDTQETRELYKHKALRSVWQKYQKKQSDIIRRKAKQLAEIERRKAEQEKRKKDKIILEKQRNDHILKMKELEKQKKLIEEKRLKKIHLDKEITEYLDDFIPETILEKIAYAQYIQNKKIIGIINGMYSQLDYLASRV